jgi:hypothetical protein
VLRIQGLGKFCRATGKLGARSSCMVGCMVLRRNPRMLVSVVMGDVYRRVQSHERRVQGPG